MLLTELSLQNAPADCQRFSWLACPYPKNQERSFKQRLMLQGHFQAAEFLDDPRELFAAAKDFAYRNLGYRFRSDCFYPSERYRSVMLRFVPFIPPIMLKEENDELVMGPSGKALTAIHLALKKMEIEADIFFVNREVVKGGKSWCKNRTDKNGALSVQDADKFDTDSMIVFSVDTPLYKQDLTAVAQEAQKYLEDTDIEIRVKKSPWRETAQFIEFGIKGREAALGHAFCQRNEGKYPGSSFVRHVFEAPPYCRYVHLSWPQDRDDVPTLNLDYYDQIVGVEIDLLWQHRSYRSMKFWQNGVIRKLRPEVGHAPDLANGNILESFYWHCRFRDCTSSNIFVVYGLDPDHPIPCEELFRHPNRWGHRQEIKRLAKNTAVWVRKQVYLPAREKIMELTAEERARGDHRAARSITNFLIENVEGAVNPDPLLGIYYLLSPEDNQRFSAPVYGPGLLELFFPECYALLKNNLSELLSEARGWKWGLDCEGARKLYEFMLEKLDGDRDKLTKVLTPIFARDDPAVISVITKRIEAVLGS